MHIEIKSIEEARSVLHCLQRTMARNSSGDLTNVLDHCEAFEKRLSALIKEGYGKCAGCGKFTDRKKEGTNTFVCIDCSH